MKGPVAGRPSVDMAAGGTWTDGMDGPAGSALLAII
jgi:hypothetical protein